MAEDQVWQAEHGRADTAPTYLNTTIEARMIRLLTVHDYDSQGLLNCSLSTAQLDELPNFIALSYTWGKEEATQKIVVNGHRCMIRRNLYNFLDTVAAKSLRGELLFIDAICIDQSNIEERGSQVSHMGTIYSKASRVIAWLGLADELLYERLASVKKTVAQLRRRGLGALSSESDTEAVLGKFQELLDAEELHVGLAEEQVNQISASPDLLVDLMNPAGFSFSYDRPFWRRVWIVQEIILAQHLTIQVGEYSLSPEDYLLGIVRSPLTSSWDANKSMRDVRPEGRRTKPAKGLLLDREYWRTRVLHGPPIV